MMCLTPNTIRNPKKVRDYTNGEDTYIKVPCRKCTACLKKRAREWMFRLEQEEKRCTSAAFMTYTYNDNNLPFTENGFPTLHPRHHTLFMKRLRKELKAQGHDPKLKYYMCGEYGSQTERPHYHAILFNLPQLWLQTDNVEEIWQNGRVQIDKVEKASIAYVCGYVNKQKFFMDKTDKETGLIDDRLAEYTRMSKNLGSNFLTPARIKKLKTDLEPTIHVEDGTIIGLPQYYRKKALNDAEIAIIGNKAKDYAEKNTIFISEKHHHDYVKADALKRKREALNSRNKI